MEFISRYDFKFVTFMTRKYIDSNVHFRNFDDYVLWLYDHSANEKDYYSRLEDDLKEYSDWQTDKGANRNDNRFKKTNGN